MGLVLLFDWSEPFPTVTPPLFSVGLLLFSFLIGPTWMCFWSVVYSLIVLLILMSPSVYSIFSDGWTPSELWSHKFRAIGFCSTAFFACLFSWTLNRLRRKREMLDNLILRMPIPVVVSEIDGRINLVNNKAKQLLDFKELVPKTGLFFDLLAPEKAQGKCISSYLNFFKLGTTSQSTLDLELEGKPIRAEVEIISTKPQKLVTMLLPAQSDNLPKNTGN